MKRPSHAVSFEVLLLQLASDGRDEALLGASCERARRAMGAFMVGEGFPDVYFEFPLKGAPFLDVTVLYGDGLAGAHVESSAAAGTEPIFAWFADAREHYPKISFGFELDTKESELPQAAIHFQPRTEVGLVRPFCEVAGIPERADLYLGLAERMPQGWPLSFFGVFRGRPDSPLRVCGYLDASEQGICAGDPAHLACVFDEVGFTAYDDAMLAGVSQLLAATQGEVDFQFDVYPDGSIGDTFAVDLQFEIERPEAVRVSFESGRARAVLGWLEKAGAADGRWKLAADAAFARAIPMERDGGSTGAYAFTLMPQWAKARWRAGVLQPAKLYCLGHADFIKHDAPDNATSAR